MEKENVKKAKRATTVISTILVTGFCMTAMVIILYASISCLKPYLIKQKMISIADKYMYIIQKYGYLTSTEENLMLNELSDLGIDIDKIQLSYPIFENNYGKNIKLKIVYDFVLPNFISEEKKQIIVIKSAYLKI